MDQSMAYRLFSVKPIVTWTNPADQFDLWGQTSITFESKCKPFSREIISKMPSAKYEPFSSVVDAIKKNVNWLPGRRDNGYSGAPGSQLYQGISRHILFGERGVWYNVVVCQRWKIIHCIYIITPYFLQNNSHSKAKFSEGEVWDLRVQSVIYYVLNLQSPCYNWQYHNSTQLYMDMKLYLALCSWVLLVTPCLRTRIR